MDAVVAGEFGGFGGNGGTGGFLHALHGAGAVQDAGDFGEVLVHGRWFWGSNSELTDEGISLFGPLQNLSCDLF